MGWNYFSIPKFQRLHRWSLGMEKWFHPTFYLPWWRYQIEAFSALLAFCAGNSPITGEFPTQRPVTRSFDVFFDLCLDKPLSKQSCGWWFGTPSCPLWRHCNTMSKLGLKLIHVSKRAPDIFPSPDLGSDLTTTVYGNQQFIWQSGFIS